MGDGGGTCDGAGADNGFEAGADPWVYALDIAPGGGGTSLTAGGGTATGPDAKCGACKEAAEADGVPACPTGDEDVGAASAGAETCPRGVVVISNCERNPWRLAASAPPS